MHIMHKPRQMLTQSPTNKTPSHCSIDQSTDVQLATRDQSESSIILSYLKELLTLHISP